MKKAILFGIAVAMGSLTVQAQTTSPHVICTGPLTNGPAIVLDLEWGDVVTHFKDPLAKTNQLAKVKVQVGDVVTETPVVFTLWNHTTRCGLDQSATALLSLSNGANAAIEFQSFDNACGDGLSIQKSVFKLTSGPGAPLSVPLHCSSSEL